MQVGPRRWLRDLLPFRHLPAGPRWPASSRGRFFLETLCALSRGAGAGVGTAGLRSPLDRLVSSPSLLQLFFVLVGVLQEPMFGFMSLFVSSLFC